MKIVKRLILVSIALILLTTIAFFIKIPYNISSKGFIFPKSEWILSKNDNGHLINIHKDYIHNTVNTYSVSEFPRGDIFEFSVNNDIFLREHIAKGDTIAFISSNEQERVLIELLGELHVQRSLLEVYRTGQKPEDVHLAYERVVLAEEELETQKKLFERVEKLYNEALIAGREYDMALNELRVKEQNLVIARSQLSTVSTGMKQQQIDYAQSRIESLENQIAQIERRIEAQVITSPLSGRIIKQKPSAENINETHIIAVGDDSQLIAVMPVNYYEMVYISLGQEVVLGINSGTQTITGRIIGIDNKIQFINRRQMIYLTVLIDNNNIGVNSGNIYFNMISDAEIKCGYISFKEYLKRAFEMVYEN